MKATLQQLLPRRTVPLLAGLACLALVPITWVHLASWGRTLPLAAAPARPVALVFGAGVTGRTPSPFLARRLELAAAAYRQGKVRAILVSGDHSRISYDESDVMRAYLADRGVPARQVVADYAGFDTWDSCVRARKVFGVHRVLVFSQQFHLPRAVMLCRAAGVDAYGVGDDSLAAFPTETLYGASREIVASAKACLDALVDRRPHFLGRHETGIDTALASRP